MAAEVAIEGISVGHFSDYEGLTGCTAVLAPGAVTASVDIRGALPGLWRPLFSLRMPQSANCTDYF